MQGFRIEKMAAAVLMALLAVAFIGCPQAADDSENAANKAAAPFITEQPTDYQPLQHEAVTLSVAATVSDGGSLSYQWYSASAVGAAGTGIAGATDFSFSPPTDTAGILYYYAEVSNSNDSTRTTTKSRYATVYVVDPSAAGTPSGGASLSVLTGDTNKHQLVRGFGGMINCWGTSQADINIKDADTLFNPDKLGLNILRMIIDPEPLEEIMDGTVYPNLDNSDLFEIGKTVNKYSGMLIACPWTPPDGFKSANDHLDPSKYMAMGEHLVTWVKKMEAGMGGNNKIYALSIQNEPNESPTWCNYTPEENLAFIKQVGPYIHQQLPGIQLFPGEHSGFVQSFYQPILDDPAALALVDGFAGHFYGGAVGQKKEWAIEKNKEVWMTEHYMNTGSNYSYDPTWAAVWSIAREFHECMVNDYNAYVMWYAKRFYCLLGDTQAGVTNQREGEPTLRGYLMSHFAKYAAGKYRYDANWEGDAAPANIFASAYADDETITLVMFNQSTTASTGSDWININLPVAVSSSFAVATYNKGGPQPTYSSIAESTAKMEPTPVVLSADKKTGSVKLPPSTIVSVRFYK